MISSILSWSINVGMHTVGVSGSLELLSPLVGRSGRLFVVVGARAIEVLLGPSQLEKKRND